ncbi:hypothetical protein HOS99_gp093 [Staphylococcus phage phiSA_BS1]|uniref:Uncharacterized protein n=2 Tax=Baoshanvirus TaxID=2732969 RepID=A0A2P1MXQ8_9CAUD|nr:hypothetical protein HOS99_gp093 [Staphylococcus phage phiSA_BS1]YP_009800016.1 hypothetical protein HOT02_gp176 [Staphylococcus phage phiSA_BS2]AVP40338.1 hypothetical protein [Staphylococcus phage phiSA_BS1]AVR55620.1 hypothetical protein phiSABS2_176 [Staphylococcus phage phiSA_BS2]
MFMYILIFIVCVGVGIHLSRKIDENWENGLYDHLYYDDDEDEDEYDEEDDYESDSDSEEVTSESNSEPELKDLDDLDRTK